MSWLFKNNYVSYTSDISCRDTRSTNCNQLYTPKPNCELFRKSFLYSQATVWNSLPLRAKHAVLVNTFKSPYLNWKHFNGHWIISITTVNLILYFVLIWSMSYFMSFLWLAWFGTNVLAWVV